MIKRNRVFDVKSIIALLCLLLSSCKKEVVGVSNDKQDINKEAVKIFCERDAIFMSDVFEQFGETQIGGDPIAGAFYEGRDGVTFIFEYQEKSSDDPFNKKYDYSKISIKAVYCMKPDESFEVLWPSKEKENPEKIKGK